MTPLDLLAPTYEQMLAALSRWLEKAEAERPEDPDAILAERLAPDMFPLSTQVRFACVQAQEGMCRLAGKPFPPSVAELLQEGRNAEEHPGSIADAKARIADTLAFVREAQKEAHAEDQTLIAHEIPIGIVFDFTAEQYARDWAIGQFYFHVTSAYAILRHSGITLGKGDYVAHLLPFARPGTMPVR